MQIPLVDVKAQYAPLIEELRTRFEEVLASGAFIRGPNVAAFEQEAAAYLGVKRTIGVANGTDALVLVLDALEIGPGDEVICPAFTFYATAESIVRRGATPVFADIDPATLNFDADAAAAAVNGRTRALLPVHRFGSPADRGGVDHGRAEPPALVPGARHGAVGSPLARVQSSGQQPGSVGRHLLQTCPCSLGQRHWLIPLEV